MLTMTDLEVSWAKTVERFVEANSDWLDDSSLPQLKALYAVAKMLDQGVRITPALVSQFTLVQRTLAAKAPGGSDDAGNPPSLLDGLLEGDMSTTPNG